MIRRILSSVVVLVALLSLPLPARAAGTLMTCVGRSVQTYAPPLTSTTRQTLIDADVEYEVCLGGPVVEGVAAVSTTAQASCLLSGSSVVTQTITWNTGQTSTTTGTTTATRTLGQTVVVTTGEVTAGLFEGAGFVQTVTLVSSDLAGCLFQGVNTVAGPLTLTFTG